MKGFGNYSKHFKKGVPVICILDSRDLYCAKNGNWFYVFHSLWRLRTHKRFSHLIVLVYSNCHNYKILLILLKALGINYILCDSVEGKDVVFSIIQRNFEANYLVISGDRQFVANIFLGDKIIFRQSIYKDPCIVRENLEKSE